MKPNERHVWFLALIAALCLPAAIWLVGLRVQTEQTQKTVNVVMTYDEVTVLAKASGRSTEEWLTALRDAGLREVLLRAKQRQDGAVARQLHGLGLETADLGGLAEGGDYFFAARYDELHDGGSIIGVTLAQEPLSRLQVFSSLEETGSLLVLVENGMQTGPVLPYSFSRSLEDYTGPMAKAFWLGRGFRARYQALGYGGAEEIENYFFRAVVDRGMTVLWIAPLLDQNKELVSDLDTYVRLLREFEARIAPAGYAYGPAVGIDYYAPAPWLLFFCGLGVIAAGALLVGLILPRWRWAAWVLFGLGALENLAAVLMPDLLLDTQITLVALLAAIAFPCLAIWLLNAWLRRTEADGRLALLRYPAALLSGVLAVLAGCLYIAGTLSGSEYLLVLKMFRGVKVSQFGVYLFAILLPIPAVLHVKGNTVWQDIRRFIPKNDPRLRRRTISVLILLAIVGTVYLLRTGDGMLSVSSVELRVRNWLENELIYRPRTKEFLLAWPAIAAALFFSARRGKIFSWLLSILGGIGFASVANTFCHSRAHFLVSLYRTFTGLAIGFGLGLLVYAALTAWFAVADSLDRRKAKGQ